MHSNDRNHETSNTQENISCSYDFRNVMYELASGNLDAVYNVFRNWDKETRTIFNIESQKKGFFDFSDMVAFYSIGDKTDDAPGCKIRDGRRKMYELPVVHYSASSSRTQAVRNATNSTFWIAAIGNSKLPIALAIVFTILTAINSSPIYAIGMILTIIWAIARLIISYKRGKHLQRTWTLFRKYGVHIVSRPTAENVG